MVLDPLPPRLPESRDIERLAFEARVTVEAVCNRAGISTQTFRNWKYDRGSPSLDTVRRLIEAGTAMLAEAQGAAAPPTQAAASRKPAAKPGAKRKAKAPARAKAAASKRQTRRRP